MKKLFAAGAIACLAVVGVGTPAVASPESAGMNHASYWESSDTNCVKVEFSDGVASFSLPMLDDVTYTMLILKAGSGSLANQVIEWPLSDFDYYHQTGKDLSHAIYCMVEEPQS